MAFVARMGNTSGQFEMNAFIYARIDRYAALCALPLIVAAFV